MDWFAPPALRRFGGRTALHAGDRAIPYSELADLVEAHPLNTIGERRVVFCEVSNDVESIVNYLACLSGGHVVHLYSEYAQDKLESLIKKFSPDILALPGKPCSFLPSQNVKKNTHAQLSILLSTSGSTGTAKLVKLSNKNLTSNANSIAEYLELTSQDVGMLHLKFSYSYGLSVLNTHLLVGASVVLTDLSVSDEAFGKLMNAHQVTGLPGVPYTFEALERAGGLASWPSLRYVTQAGGRLDPSRVRSLSRLGKNRGFRFYVMYGQTEAAPRMAYLPHDLCESHPDCIGVAIPSGRLWIADSAGNEISEPLVEGQIMYEGPNVMMGYAQSYDDLAGDETSPYLATGDLGMCDAHGLYRVTGRVSRFVKPFGLRINLDSVEADLREVVPNCVVTGTDDKIVIYRPGKSATDPETLLAYLVQRLKLPAWLFEIVDIDRVPRLTNGKVDYKGLKHASASKKENDARGPLDIVLSREFASSFASHVAQLVGFSGRSGFTTVAAAYKTLLGSEINASDTFKSLGGDSLSYVQVSLALEAVLGRVPEGWEAMSVDELEGRRIHAGTI